MYEYAHISQGSKYLLYRISVRVHYSNAIAVLKVVYSLYTPYTALFINHD